MTRTLADALAEAARAEVLQWDAEAATPKWSDLVHAFLMIKGYEGSRTARAAAAADDFGYHFTAILGWMRDSTPPPPNKFRALASVMGFPPELVLRVLKIANAVRPVRQAACDHRTTGAGN